MRILFLTQVLPYPLNAGPKVRAYYVLRYLAEQGHDVTLLSFVRPDDTPEHIAQLEGFCRAVHTVPMRRSRVRDAFYLLRSLFAGRSFIIARDSDRAMHGLVERLLAEGEWDAVHADQLWMAQYAGQGSGARRVLDAHNAVYLIPQRLAERERNPLKRWVLGREWRAMACYEGDVCRRFDRVVTVTEEDRVLLEGLSADACHSEERSDEESRDASLSLRVTDAGHYTVIPICIDPADKPVIPPRVDANRILILGTMFWPPNVEGALWFAREVLPWVLREVPGARLTVIGKNPPAELQRLGVEHRTTETQRTQREQEQRTRAGTYKPQMNTDEHRYLTTKRTEDTKTKQENSPCPLCLRGEIYQRPSAVPENSNIDILGYVEDPVPYLEETAVFVVPLHAGGGMRVKILDAWCWGMPIVSTTVGAEGIAVRDGENILIADDARRFAGAVVRAMTDPDLNRWLRDNGRAWVEQRYDWRTVYRRWDEVYKENETADGTQIELG